MSENNLYEFFSKINYYSLEAKVSALRKLDTILYDVDYKGGLRDWQDRAHKATMAATESALLAADALQRLQEARQQLTAAEAEKAELREKCAVLQSQVDNADVNLEQVKMNARAMWRIKVESAESTIASLTAQLEKAKRKVRFANEQFARINEDDNEHLSFEQKALAASSRCDSLRTSLADAEKARDEAKAEADAMRKAAQTFIGAVSPDYLEKGRPEERCSFRPKLQQLKELWIAARSTPTAP